MHQQNLTGLVKKSGFSIDRKVAKKVDPSGVQKSYDINVNSPQQVQKLVYGHLGFPVLETTDSGQPATGAEALRTFDHPIVREIVTVKSMLNTQKFFKTYLLHSIANAEGPGVDILHPTFNQDGAKTRRYSAKDPNLQNVPNAITTKSVMPIQARIPFGPRPGKVWIHNDWSQEELRIFAAESGDQALLADLATGDIFTVATNRILGKRINPQTGQVEHYDIVAEEAKVNKKTSRSKIKILSYGIIYGGGADAASRSLGCSRAEAQALLDQYHETYHRIRPFMDDLISLAGQQGYIWNRFNWRMEVNKEYAYQAVNYLIQSSAAAYLKSKLVWLWKYYRAHPEIGARIVMTIHDEIVTEVEEAKILPHLSIIKAELENHHGIWPEIPNLPVEFKMARERWDVQEHMEVA